LLLRVLDYEKLLAALKKADRAQVILNAGTGWADWIEPLLQVPELVATASDALRRKAAQAEQQEHAASTSTCFGAVFLLLPVLAELPAERVGAHRAGALRFAIFRKCCPAAMFNHVTRDPLVRTFSSSNWRKRRRISMLACFVS